MKKVLVMVAGIMLLATSVNAAGPAAFIALYTDEAQTIDSAYGFGNFDVCHFILPSDNGATVAEYRMIVEAIPMSVPSFGFDIHPDVTLSEGVWIGDPGIKAAFGCQNDWFAICTLHLGLYSTDPGYLAIVPYLELGYLRVGGCDDDKTLEPLNPKNKFGLNQDGIVDNEASTWGAIKSLINE